MIEINKFSFEAEGVIIKFSPCPITEQDPIQKYSFAVEEDEELTKKLIESVKNKTVTQQSFWYCANALFEIIRTNSFGSIVTDEEIAYLYEKFQKEFGESPEFNFEDISTIRMPLFTAYLAHQNVAVVGSGRTKQNSRADALKKFFMRYEELK